MDSLQLAGASFYALESVVTPKGAHNVLHVECEVSQPLADRLEWQLFTGKGRLINGLGKNVNLTGHLLLSRFAFQGKGIGITPLMLPATAATNFKLFQQSDNVRLRFLLTTTAWRESTEFFCTLGHLSGVLAVEILPQTMRMADKSEPQMELTV